MSRWLRRRWGGIWRLLGGVSLRVKIMGIALAMIALLGLGLTCVNPPVLPPIKM